MPDYPFVQYLRGLAESDNRAALAALRRGLGKPWGTAPEMYQYVVPWIGEKTSKAEENAKYLVAALFASYPKHRETVRTLGDTLRRTGGAEGGSRGTERRFVAMLKAHSEDLDTHLRHAISLARAKDAPVNYNRLLEDLTRWDRPDRRAQREWALDFWGGGKTAEEYTEETISTVVTYKA